jgi:hypothetical protein
MSMGSIAIRTARGARLAQFFWDSKEGFLDIDQSDGSVKRTKLKSPAHARKRAWIATQDALYVGYVVEAYQ